MYYDMSYFCYRYDIKRERDIFQNFPKLLRVPTILFRKTEYQKCSAKEFILHQNIFVVIFLK